LSETVDYGPQAEAVQAIINRFDALTTDQKTELANLRDDAFWAAWNVAGGGRAVRAGLGAARFALYGRLRGWGDGVASYGAALAVLLRHTFTPEEQVHYEALTRPWVTVVGWAHPDDEPRPTDTKTEGRGETSVTSEIGALSAIVEEILPLDDDARARVLNYLNDRFSGRAA
jgi:hypothetical protein